MGGALAVQVKMLIVAFPCGGPCCKLNKSSVTLRSAVVFLRGGSVLLSPLRRVWVFVGLASSVIRLSCWGYLFLVVRPCGGIACRLLPVALAGLASRGPAPSHSLPPLLCKKWLWAPLSL